MPPSMEAGSSRGGPRTPIGAPTGPPHPKCSGGSPLWKRRAGVVACLCTRRRCSSRSVSRAFVRPLSASPRPSTCATWSSGQCRVARRPLRGACSTGSAEGGVPGLRPHRSRAGELRAGRCTEKWRRRAAVRLGGWAGRCTEKWRGRVFWARSVVLGAVHRYEATLSAPAKRSCTENE